VLLAETVERFSESEEAAAKRPGVAKSGLAETSSTLAGEMLITAAKKNHTGMRNAKRTPGVSGLSAASKIAARQIKVSNRRDGRR
jgi:hypothetical protein